MIDFSVSVAVGQAWTQAPQDTHSDDRKSSSIPGDTTEATDKPESAVDEQLAIVGVSLTPEQESAADRIQEQYLSQLRMLNRGIDGFHTRLVSLEADKFVEIEKILTEEQLKQLREIRQSAPIAIADKATRKISVKRTK